MEYQNKTELVPAICTQCSGQLQVDPTKDAAICPYCGTAFVVEKAINVYHQQQITIDKSVVGHADNVNINSGPNGNLASAMYYTDKLLDRRTRLKIEKEHARMEIRKFKAEQKEKDLKTAFTMFMGLMGAIIVFLLVLYLFAKL